MKKKSEYFTVVERNGNAVITFSVSERHEAEKELQELVKYPNEWRLDQIQDDEGNEVEE
jgi:hypothetical protein